MFKLILKKFETIHNVLITIELFSINVNFFLKFLKKIVETTKWVRKCLKIVYFFKYFTSFGSKAIKFYLFNQFSNYFSFIGINLKI